MSRSAPRSYHGCNTEAREKAATVNGLFVASDGGEHRRWESAARPTGKVLRARVVGGQGRAGRWSFSPSSFSSAFSFAAAFSGSLTKESYGLEKPDRVAHVGPAEIFGRRAVAY